MVIQSIQIVTDNSVITVDILGLLGAALLLVVAGMILDRIIMRYMVDDAAAVRWVTGTNWRVGSFLIVMLVAAFIVVVGMLWYLPGFLDDAGSQLGSNSRLLTGFVIVGIIALVTELLVRANRMRKSRRIFMGSTQNQTTPSGH